MPEIYLIRHAKADERGAKYPNDAKRPLIDKGVKQAQTLAKVFTALNIAFDHIFSSPYTRAAQTAKPLEACLKSGRIQYLDSLTGSDDAGLLKDIQSHSGKAETIALVGHEPYLGGFASFLLGTKNLNMNFKKSAFILLSGRLEAGKMTLDMFVPYSIYKHFN